MRVLVSTSAALSAAAKNKIQKADWFDYKGRKVLFDNHHKSYDIDIAKGDQVGFIPNSNGTYTLLHSDDPAIYFKVSSAEHDAVVLKSVPYYGLVQKVPVISDKKLLTLSFSDKHSAVLLNSLTVAKLKQLCELRGITGISKKPELVRALVKADKTGTKKTAAAPVKKANSTRRGNGKVEITTPKAPLTRPSKPVQPKTVKPKVNPSELKEGVIVSVKIEDETVQATVVEDAVGSRVRVVAKKGSTKNMPIFVDISSINRIVPQKVKELTPLQKEKADYDTMHELTGAGTVVRHRGVEYVVVYKHSRKATSKTPFDNKLALVPIDENKPLITLDVNNLEHLQSMSIDTLSLGKYNEYKGIFDRRKSELDEKSNAAAAINNAQIAKFGVKEGDSTSYRFPNGAVQFVIVRAINYEKGLIAIREGSKLRWLPGKNIEYIKRTGDTEISMDGSMGK